MYICSQNFIDQLKSTNVGYLHICITHDQLPSPTVVLSDASSISLILKGKLLEGRTKKRSNENDLFYYHFNDYVNMPIY